MRTQRTDNDGETSTTAHYARDEVSGPLGHADTPKQGKDKVISDRAKFLVDTQGPDVVERLIEQHKIRTPSEEHVGYFLRMFWSSLSWH